MANILAATRRAGLTGEDAVRALGRAMRPVTSYGDVGVDDGESGLSVGRVPGFAAATFAGLALVGDAPPGGTDFTDPRYWLRFTVPVATKDAGAVLAFGTVPDKDGASYAVGLNLAEVAPKSNATGATGVKGCHLLSPGTPVAVFLAVDDLGVERYVFSENPSPVRVRITDNSGCGAGHYNATATKLPTADVDKSAALTSSLVGAAGPTVIVRNLQERDRPAGDAWITHADNVFQKDFSGVLSRVNADGTAVIDVNALWADECDSGGGA